MKKQLPIQAGAGRGSIAQGFQPTIQQLADQLGVEVHSLKERLAAGDIEGEPTAYSGARLFEPEALAFAVDAAQAGVATALVNYVVHDGQVYDIPIIVSGPGVFIAMGFGVEITQRRFDPGVTEPMWVNYNSCWSGFPYNAAAAPPGIVWTTKFSLWPTQPAVLTAGGVSSGVLPASIAMNFFWNLLDARTGDLYSDEPMNHLALRPRQSAAHAGSADGLLSQSPHMDGGLFLFDTPWVFPYGTQAVFKFQPINPVLQYDSTVSGAAAGLGYEDREQGVRNQSVIVKPFISGYRMMVSPGV